MKKNLLTPLLNNIIRIDGGKTQDLAEKRQKLPGLKVRGGRALFRPRYGERRPPGRVTDKNRKPRKI
jgi:hypothetical protein